MEAKLEKLVTGLMRIADIRNLDFDNPVKITLQTGELFPVITLVSLQEPFRGKYPLDVVWVDANPISPSYKKIFKRSSKQSNPATPQWTHSWTELFRYNDVFVPNQHYADGDDENVVALQEVLDHIHNIVSNPHNTTASAIGALPVAGGTMLGDLILNADPIPDSSPKLAVTKSYVDARYNLLLNAVDTLTQQASGLEDSVNSLAQVELPTINNKIQTINIRQSQQEQNTITNTNLLAALQSVVSQHSIDIAQLNQTIGIGQKYLTEDAFNTFVDQNYAPFKTDHEALKTDYEAFKQLALGIFNAAHTRVKTFEFVQNTAAQTWTIPHNLNTTSFVVGLLDASNETLYAGTVQAIDTNNILVSYNTPLTGKAVVIGLT